MYYNSVILFLGKIFRMDTELAKDFYGEHKSKFFYRRLVEFMTSGPVEVLVLAKDNAIADWRTILGPTKVFKSVISHPDSIRAQFGLTDTRNVGHGSGKLHNIRCALFNP